MEISSQTTSKTFSVHVKERAVAALKGINRLENIRSLSLDTAMKLFNTTIVPILVMVY